MFQLLKGDLRGWILRKTLSVFQTQKSFSLILVIFMDMKGFADVHVTFFMGAENFSHQFN